MGKYTSLYYLHVIETGKSSNRLGLVTLLKSFFFKKHFKYLSLLLVSVDTIFRRKRCFLPLVPGPPADWHWGHLWTLRPSPLERQVGSKGRTKGSRWRALCILFSLYKNIWLPLQVKTLNLSTTQSSHLGLLPIFLRFDLCFNRVNKDSKADSVNVAVMLRSLGRWQWQLSTLSGLSFRTDGFLLQWNLTESKNVMAIV